MPVEERDLARAFSAGTYRLVVAQLFGIAEKSLKLGKPHTAVAALEAVAAAQAKHDQLTGLQMAAKLDVKVTSASDVIDLAEAQLKAILEAGR